jgi:hypothetical protein
MSGGAIGLTNALCLAISAENASFTAMADKASAVPG